MQVRSSASNEIGLWLSALVGMAAGAVVIAAWWVLYSVGVLTFPPFDLGDYIIRHSPGEFATWAIETLGSRAQRAALTGGLLAWMAAWALLGLAVGRVYPARPALLAPIAMLPFAFSLGWWSEAGLGTEQAIWFVLAFGLTLLGGGVLLALWLGRLADATREANSPASDWLDHPGDYQRRALLRQIALVALATGVGGPVIGRWLGSVRSAEAETSQSVPLTNARAAFGSPVAVPTSLPAVALPDAFVAPAGVRPRTTSNDEFYVVDISTRDPNLEELSWSLRVHGLVDRELFITWLDLLSMPSVELDGTLMCISYEHDNGLISSTRWTGVPLRDVLERAGIGATTLDLACRGANGYSDSIPLAKALEPTTLLVYGMNGTTLPRSHGFPCRLYAPGLYGEKQVKWLQEIELVDYDYRGFWQERGWTDTAIVNTVSIIDTPRGTVLREDDIVPVAGIAFSGDRGIGAVQVSIDDGAWQEAVLEANDPPLIWQRWRFDWTPDLGSYHLTARAIDLDGNAQEESERPPHPDGMTGLHSVSVDVV
ncbi:MAG TPA: molybdopterin-dependent oxidoreductase [Thermomicrobiales bacterium]|nr:molybdopterin-dependent oxidoreductase [Thermomicrobiales bacterium]